MLRPVCQLLHSKTHALTSSFEVENGFMEKMPRQYDTPSLTTSSSAWSTKSGMMKKESMSKWLSAWVLPSSYDLENLHGIHGPQTSIASSSHTVMLPSTPPQ